ncbi:MATE family efflux transporter, partial [Eubacteriales bacterium DFI.9.88]|nr:MATE family efflux transporter [Eubacteriales bacterium DFI.9.88]
GEEEGEDGDHCISFPGTLRITFLFSLVLAALCLLNMDRLLMFLGSTPDILPHARAYAIPYFICIPFSITGTAVFYYTRAIGKPLASAISYIAPAIV